MGGIFFIGKDENLLEITEITYDSEKIEKELSYYVIV